MRKKKSHLILLYRLFELILQKWYQMVVYMLEHLLHGWHHLSNTDFFLVGAFGWRPLLQERHLVLNEPF